jgi:hypothetical protein
MAIAEGPSFRRILRLPPARIRKGTRGKPVAGYYQVGTNPIDTDSTALIVKNWTGPRFRRSGIRRPQPKNLEEYVELDELRHNQLLKDVL